MGKNGKAKGVVTGSLVGIASMIIYTHEDGSQCPRPGPRDLPIGTLIESEFSVESGLCEHLIVSVKEPKPVPVPKVLTVADILQHVEAKKTQPKRAALPEADVVSEEIIAKAKIPPRIKSNISTAPAAVQAVMKLPVDARFDGDLSGYSPEEIAELTRGPRTEYEPIGDGEPVSPFFNDFSASPTKPQQGPGPVRGGNKPVSPFDR